MASSNRHWPSMFKSKPCNTHHQWQHDINSSLMSTGCHRSPYTSGCEERSPDPKPRWNPKPEQIRILEAIFNSGMVNPPRDEIRKIRAQLQEYGQVGDANVFYWFQNRKSRSKHKLRHLQNSKNQGQQIQNSTISSSSSSTVAPRSTRTGIAPCSSSSSSEKSSPKTAPAHTKKFSVGFSKIPESTSNSPTASVNRASYLQSYSEAGLPVEPFFPVQHTGGVVQHNGGAAAGTANLTQGFCFSELSNVVQVPQHFVGPCTSLLLSEIMNHGASKKGDQEERTMKMHHPNQLSFLVPTTTSPQSHVSAISSSTVTIPSYISQIEGVGEPTSVGLSPPSSTKSTVFINDVAFDVPVGPFNVREAFGVDSVLIHSSGQPVLTNEWGLTLQSLQHGASYYLI